MDREKVIKEAEEFIKHLAPDDKHKRHIGIMVNLGWIYDVIALLKEQEAVEPKIGHWIWLQFCANEGVYCSECHTKMFDRYPMKKKLSQFCGHCGAKMDDEAEGR